MTKKKISKKKTTKKKPKKKSVSHPKMKAYASFEHWKRDQTDQHQRLITQLTKVIEKTAPQFERFVKWGQGCWIQDNRPKVFIHCASDHLQFGFYVGSQLKDPKKLLVGNGAWVRHIKVFTTKDIKIHDFSKLIKQVSS